MDRRAGFFLIAAAACFALTPLADPPHRPISIVTGIVYVILAGLSALDRASRNAQQRRPSATPAAGAEAETASRELDADADAV